MQTMINIAVALCVLGYTGYKRSYSFFHPRLVGTYIIGIGRVQCLDKKCIDHPRGRPRGIDTVASI